MQLLCVDAAALPTLPCACATLRRATRAITQSYAMAFRHTGLEVTQFILLQTLHHAGELTQRELGELLVLDTATLSRSLSPLERHNWIAVRPGQDRREKRIRITRAGQASMAKALEPWNRVQSQLRNLLGETGWKESMHAIEKVTAAALILGKNPPTKTKKENHQ